MVKEGKEANTAAAAGRPVPLPPPRWRARSKLIQRGWPSSLARNQSRPDSPCDPLPDTTASSPFPPSAAALQQSTAPVLSGRGNPRRYSQERRGSLLANQDNRAVSHRARRVPRLSPPHHHSFVHCVRQILRQGRPLVKNLRAWCVLVGSLLVPRVPAHWQWQLAPMRDRVHCWQEAQGSCRDTRYRQQLVAQDRHDPIGSVLWRDPEYFPCSPRGHAP